MTVARSRSTYLAMAASAVALLVAAWLLLRTSESPAPAPGRAPGDALLPPAAETRAPTPPAAGQSQQEPSEALPPEPEEQTLAEKRDPIRLFGDAQVSRAMDGQRRTLGVRIRNVGPGSFWEQMGVEHDDIILELNGELLDSPQGSVTLLNAVARDDRFSIRVRRTDGELAFLDFEAPPEP